MRQRESGERQSSELQGVSSRRGRSSSTIISPTSSTTTESSNSFAAEAVTSSLFDDAPPANPLPVNTAPWNCTCLGRDPRDEEALEDAA